MDKHATERAVIQSLAHISTSPHVWPADSILVAALDAVRRSISSASVTTHDYRSHQMAIQSLAHTGTCSTYTRWQLAAYLEQHQALDAVEFLVGFGIGSTLRLAGAGTACTPRAF
jgi:hypothetical protein